MEKVVNVIATYLDIQHEDIKPETELRSLTEDSLDWIEIILALEEEFLIDIPDEQIDKLITIQDIATYVDICVREEKTNQCGAV